MNLLGIDIGGSAVKAALVTDGAAEWHSRGPSYTRPDASTLAAALQATLRELPRDKAIDHVGLCLPGTIDEHTGAIAASANLPGLIGVRPQDLLRGVPGLSTTHAARVLTDAHAAAHDAVLTLNLTGRTLALSMGTGIGAAVLDRGNEHTDPRPLIVSGRGPGHIGQIDCTVMEPDGSPPPIGPDGGRGGLEAYMGLPALRRRFGDQLESALAALPPSAPPLSALVRAIRVAHAIYRPDHVVLLGGIGIRLAPHAPALHAAVSDGLTSLARTGWTLRTGATEFHAAIGAARLADPRRPA